MLSQATDAALQESTLDRLLFPVDVLLLAIVVFERLLEFIAVGPMAIDWFACPKLPAASDEVDPIVTAVAF